MRAISPCLLPALSDNLPLLLHHSFAVISLCMAFRHRHFSLSRLIETAEMEPGKAETGEKEAGCEEDESAIRRESCPRGRFLLVPLCLSEAWRQQFSRTLLEYRASA